MFWKCGKYTFDTRVPVIMGILNVTPDSFSDGGKNFDPAQAVENAKTMIEQGAQIIDVGGESTRPGASAISAEEEWERIKDVVAALVAQDICVSIDTYHPETAKLSLEAGASIINDITGFTNPGMVEAVKNSDCGLVVMHSRGNAKTMDSLNVYDDIVEDVREFLKAQAEMLQGNGVDAFRICVDPGPGFAKDAQQTSDVLYNMQEFRHLGFPVMVAISRKRFLSKVAGRDDLTLDEKDALTAELSLRAAEAGATIIRVHNVPAIAKEAKNFRPLVVLGLGGNIAKSGNTPAERQASIIEQLNVALQYISQMADTELIDVAPFYASEAAYYEDQDDFVNTIAAIRTGLPPLELLEYIHFIENMLGRVREIEKGPRTVDIDIEDYQMYVCESEKLTLPHPLSLERDFVVKPWQDILPGHICADGKPIDLVAEEARVGRATKID